ncbi:MAG: hypothetical protein ACRCYL_09690 [Kluyvera sp.]
MLKKTIITSAVVSALLLSSSGIAATSAGDKSGAQMPTASQHVMSSDSYGEIIGQFNSPDGTVMGATLPGKSVSFSIPSKKITDNICILPSCMPPLRQKAGSSHQRQNRGLNSPA